LYFSLDAPAGASVASYSETNVKARVFELDVQPDRVVDSSTISIRFAMEGEAP
jgi:hypothetical protein